MSNIIDSIRLSGTTYQIQGEVTVDTALDSGSTNPVENRAIYNKIDEVEQVTAAALNELNEALSGKQDTLSAGTNITISGNVISAEGGGKAIEAGRGISITTGETADTVSLGVPISAGTGTNSIIEGYYTTASGQLSHAEGYYTTASGQSSHAEGDTTVASGISSHAEGYRTLANGRYSHAEGNRTSASGQSSHAEGYRTLANGSSSHAEGEYTTANGNYSHSEGQYTETTNQSEHASGQYNVSNSASTEFGDSGNTLFSVGNGDWSGRHNAFEIRQNGDIYLTSGGTDIKLQDHLGGSSITVDTELNSGSTNPVENRVIYNKIDEIEEVTAAGLNALNDKITPTVELTQAQYDALVTAGTVSADTYYIITDAQAVDLTNYYTKSETNTLLGGKQATLVSGTNIKTINNESILGSGNIDIQGGSTYTAGRGISIANDTISFSLPISAGTGSNSIIENSPYNKATNNYAHAEGYQTSATSYYCHSEGRGTKATNEACHAEGKSTEASGDISHAEGEGTKALGQHSHAEGYYTTASSVTNVSGMQMYYGYKSRHAEGCSTFANNGCTHTEGYYTQANNFGEHASGLFNVSNSATTTFGNSGNTLFSVGNGTSASARHNAFEIRQNGDIYLSLNGQDVKLQDQLGGSSITVDTALDSGSTNPVENRVIYNKIDEVEQVTAAGLNAVNDKFDGLRLNKLTQAQYDALATKDPSTLYVIVD